MVSVVISERSDISKQLWYHAQHSHKGFLSGGTLMLENRLLENVLKWGLEVTKISPDPGT